MVTIEELNESHVEDVLQIALKEEQVQYSGTAEDFLSDGRNTSHLHVIKVDDEVVGFFKLNLLYSSTHVFCTKKSIGLMSFVIDINQQGKGVGAASVRALLQVLKERYFAYESVYLTVNCKNPGARACYRKGGFEDTGELFLEGEVGPQVIMREKIT